MGTRNRKGLKADEIDENELRALEEELDELNLRIITIYIEKVENIEPEFTATDIHVEIKHSEIFLGQSEKIMVHEKKLILIDYEFELPLNVELKGSLDTFLTCPLYFTVWQSAGQLDLTLYPTRSETTDDSQSHVIRRGSILSLYEAILGVKWDEGIEDEVKKTGSSGRKDKAKDKGKLSKVSSKSPSKISKKSEESVKFGPRTVVEIPPVYVGSANLDFLPFFFGELEISDKKTLYPDKVYVDEDIVAISNLPQLTIKVTINKPLFDPENEDKLTTLFNVTVESMCNIPECFTERLGYQCSTILPAADLTFKHYVFENSVYKKGPSVFPEFKLWPDLANMKDFSAHTDMRIDEITSNIKNKLGITINDQKLQGSRISWNVCTKCWLTENATDFLEKNVIRYRQWPIEVFVFSKMKRSQQRGKGDRGKSTTGTIEDRSVRGTDTPKPFTFTGDSQHFMGFVDISNLLYPGVTKVRVACELRTFRMNELKKETCIEESYFLHKKPPHLADKDGKKDRKKDKKETSSKGKNSVVVETDDADLPSLPILNESGEPVFIVLEFELSKPFKQRRTIEDLTKELRTILPSSSVKPCVVTTRFATQFFQETIRQIATALNVEYQKYIKENKDVQPINFIKHLQQSGIYQSYFTTLSRAVLMLVKEKFSYKTDFKTTYTFTNYVSNIYVYLLNILNNQIHEYISCELAGCAPVHMKKKDYLFYTKEAVECQAFLLSERYHLQAINDDTQNPVLWFNFAVFYLTLQNIDKAFECLKEALVIQLNHKYSLLLFGILLFEKTEHYLAESTLLNLVSHHPLFEEGWVCLYMLYMKRHQYEGCDFCLEMLAKYKDAERDRSDDYIYNNDEIAWTTSICNSSNVFYRTALVLIKIQALKFADMALSTENFMQDGAYRYYQGVISYYLKDYDDALMHLFEAQKLHGPDYAVNSLIGHCYFRLEKYEDAKESYMFIVESFNRPESMHLLYSNLAQIYEKENNLQEARKYLYYVCKQSPTAYIWLLMGILYFKERNFENAEACLEESNFLDNRLPETWAYLTLINIQSNKKWEAEQCFHQMERFNLKNESLLEEVTSELQKIMNM